MNVGDDTGVRACRQRERQPDQPEREREGAASSADNAKRVLLVPAPRVRVLPPRVLLRRTTHVPGPEHPEQAVLVLVALAAVVPRLEPHRRVDPDPDPEAEPLERLVDERGPLVCRAVLSRTRTRTRVRVDARGRQRPRRRRYEEPVLRSCRVRRLRLRLRRARATRRTASSSSDRQEERAFGPLSRSQRGCGRCCGRKVGRRVRSRRGVRARAACARPGARRAVGVVLAVGASALHVTVRRRVRVRLVVPCVDLHLDLHLRRRLVVLLVVLVLVLVLAVIHRVGVTMPLALSVRVRVALRRLDKVRRRRELRQVRRG